MTLFPFAPRPDSRGEVNNPATAAPLVRNIWKLRIIFLLIVSLMSFALVEIVLRVLGLDYTSPYVHDPNTGARLKANHGFLHRSEGRVWVTTNSEGLRDREHTIAKPAGTYRIAVLGDSFAEALQVERDKTFWAVLERELNQSPSTGNMNVEVLNFGISGFGTTQSLQMLRHSAWKYEPDLVILAFLPSNDIRNNSKELETDRGRPFYQINKGTLVLDTTFAEDPIVKHFRESKWLQFKDQCICHSRALSLVYRISHPLPAPSPSSESSNEAGLDDYVFAPPKDIRWEKAWGITGKVLGIMANEVAEHDCRLVVLAVNNGVEVSPDANQTQQLAASLGSADLSYPDRRMKEFSRLYGFNWISPTESMRSAAIRDGIYFHGFDNTKPGVGHWNEHGHEFAGQFLATELTQRWSELIRSSHQTATP